MAALLTTQFTTAQVTLYLSNLNQPVGGNNILGYGDAEIFVGILTGSNPAGYDLNSIQVLMANATGSPESGSFFAEFTTTNNNSPSGTPVPLTGSSNPTTSGTYTYTAPANTLLAANTDYWLMLFGFGGNSGDGYQWSYTDTTTTTSIGGWSLTGNVSTGGGIIPAMGIPIFSLGATPVPEPHPLALSVLGGLGLLLFYRKSSVTGIKAKQAHASRVTDI